MGRSLAVLPVLAHSLPTAQEQQTYSVPRTAGQRPARLLPDGMLSARPGRESGEQVYPASFPSRGKERSRNTLNKKGRFYSMRKIKPLIAR
jgi:hypothetical protein